MSVMELGWVAGRLGKVPGGSEKVHDTWETEVAGQKLGRVIESGMRPASVGRCRKLALATGMAGAMVQIVVAGGIAG